VEVALLGAEIFAERASSLCCVGGRWWELAAMCWTALLRSREEDKKKV
jgi:hypothetical protein